MNTDLIKQDNNFYSYQTDDFVSIFIKHIFNIENSPKNYCLAKILCSYMMRTNQIYKTEKEIQDKSKSLYRTMFFAHTEIKGTKLFIYLSLKMIDQKVINDDFFNEAINFFKDMITKPNFSKGKLDKQVLEEIKKDITNSVQRVEKNPDQFQSILFYRNMLPESDFNYKNPSFEELKDMLDSIKDKDIIDFYHTTLDRHIATFSFGNLNDKENKIIKDSFKFKSCPFDYSYDHKENLSDDYKVIKSNDTTQSYLYVAYDITDYKKENTYIYYALLPMLNPFKGLCHKILRDELGIVYQTYADFLSNRGIFMICAQIDKKNTDKALAGIDEIMKRILDKDFLEEMLTFTKEKYTQELDTSTELLNSNIVYLERYILKNEMLKKELVDKINTLTVDDIIRQINNLKKKYIFLYEGDKDEN